MECQSVGRTNYIFNKDFVWVQNGYTSIKSIKMNDKTATNDTFFASKTIEKQDILCPLKRV